MASWNYPFYDLKYGVTNLISYFNIIWNDRDWDSIYWLELNQKKLIRMENLIRNHGNHLYHERDADSIHKAIMAIDRLLEDNYFNNALVTHNKKWGELVVTYKDLEDGCSEMLFDRKNINSSSEEQERQEFLKLSKHSDYMRKQDLKYLTDTINTYLFSWWD